MKKKIITKHIEIFNVEYSHYLFPEDFEKDTGFKITNEEGIVCELAVWIHPNSPDSVYYHEAMHIVDFILEDHLKLMAQPLSSTSEIRAYITEHIAVELLKNVNQ